jgi:hypothetical protein
MSVISKFAAKGEEWNGAYERILFPDPALEQTPHQKCENAMGRKHARLP